LKSDGVDTVNPKSATDTDYNDSNEPIIYVSNCFLRLMSTLGAMGFKEMSAKKKTEDVWAM
jgi:hypothetical protein